MGCTSLIGFVLLFAVCVRYTWTGYCSDGYECSKTCTKRERYTSHCGLFGWGRCHRYRRVTYRCTGTCYRKVCCAGYTGSACETPVCFGSAKCPHGGSCVSPDRCACRSGYSSPNCADINECATNNGGCQHDCTNTEGSSRCSCRSGYLSGNGGKTCKNINECATNNGGCQQICSDLQGSYNCRCKPGYRLNYDGKTCSDINECHNGSSGCAQICRNSVGSFSCSCNHGYISHGNQCNDIDECVAGTSGCSQICSNTQGSYTCSCSDGFSLNTDGKSCSAISYCSTSSDLCDQVCVDVPGTYNCQCRTGYRLNSDAITCSDINECIDRTSRCSQSCSNTEGSFQCSCLSGYTLFTDKRTCMNFDDCLSSPCLNNGTCVDQVLGFTCTCTRGFTGIRCEDDFNECMINNGGCQDVCTNSNGSFTCSCNNGRTLDTDGTSCIGGSVQNVTVFERNNLARQHLPRGCHTIVLSSCPDGNNIEVHLSSTSQWYTSSADQTIIYSPGVIFAEVNDLVLPVSLTGITVNKQVERFTLSSGVKGFTTANRTSVGITRSSGCLSLNFTSSDIYQFITANSFLKTIFDGFINKLPNFIGLDGRRSMLLDVSNMKTDYIYGRDIDGTTWCEGAPVIMDHVYSIFRFGTNFQLSIYGNEVNIQSPLQNKQFCLIVDICHSNGGSIFLMLPEGSRHVLMDFDFFKHLKIKQSISIFPRGIGISFVKGVAVEKFGNNLQLWNGDQFFTYRTFTRGDVWVGGYINYNEGILNLTADVDAYISLPNPSKILTGVFIDEWNVLVHAAPSQADLQFQLNGQNYSVRILDINESSVDVYLSVGGLHERKWCGDGSPAGIANPPGAFFSTVISINPFKNIPILGDWIIKASTRLYGFFTTDTLKFISPDNSISIIDDILQINETLDRLETFLHDLLQSGTESFMNVTYIIDDVKDTQTTLMPHLTGLGGIVELSNFLPNIWDQFVKIQSDVNLLSDAVEFTVTESKKAAISFFNKELDELKINLNSAIQKVSNQVTSAVQSYSSFGGKFTIDLIILGLDLGELDIELSISNDIVAKCSRFSAVYNLLKGERAVRILARYSREKRLGFFLVAKTGAGIGGAFGMATNNLVIQIEVYIEILGISVTEDVFITKDGLRTYFEGNIWNIFLVHIDMSASLGDEWYKLTFRLKGRFLAKARRKRQIQSQGSSFQSSYLDALTKLVQNVANGASRRLDQAQNALSKAQNGITKAQSWLEDKKDVVRKANGAFDVAVTKLESAKQKLEAAKGPFEDALRKLSAAQRKVDNLCRIRHCRKICIPGLKCRICHKKIWFVNVPYPCCRFTSCMIGFPDPICVIANLACRGLRLLAYGVLEAAKLFVKVPMAALDLAKGVVSTAQFIVDKSRIVLTVAESALEIAIGALDVAKGVIEGAHIALEALKFTIRGAVKVFEFVVQYGLKALLDVRNCGFEIEISTTDYPVFGVSCEVNAFRLGWKTVEMRIDFRNAFQTIWRAAKATIDVIVKGFSDILGRRKREIAYQSTRKLHKVLGTLRQYEGNATYGNILEEIINVVNQTIGMRDNITKSYDGRVKWFKDKCEYVQRLHRFLFESFGALHEIANESKSSMEMPSNLTRWNSQYDIHEMINHMTLETANISIDYGVNVYNLSSSEMETALLDAKKIAHRDELIMEINNITVTSDALIADEMKNVDTISIIEYWKQAIETNTSTYFEEDECTGFDDCLYFAMASIYDLYEDEFNLPHITTIKKTISDLESNILRLIQNNVTTAKETYELADAVYSSIQSLNKLNVFCSLAPIFTIPFQNLTVIPGSSVYIQCRTSANPEATIWWYKDGRILSDQNRENLVIEDASKTNEGQYMCTAGNLVANITSPDITLSVVEPQELCIDHEETDIPVDDSNCRTFIHCGDSEVRPICCRVGRGFDSSHGKCVPADTSECFKQECPVGYEEECRFEPMADSPLAYRDVDAPGSPVKQCIPGTTFMPEACGCRLLNAGGNNDCKTIPTAGPTVNGRTVSNEVTTCPEGHMCKDNTDETYECFLNAVDGAPHMFEDTLNEEILTCTPGTIYNPQTCDCACPPNNNGCFFLPVPGHPRKYLYVADGVVGSCPSRTVFNPYACSCDYVHR